MIDIDGSYGEGGGQVLRTALSWAALLATPLRVRNIRAGRKKPGLAAQHMTGARAVAEICHGELSGCEFGSQELVLAPGVIRGGQFRFDVADVRPSAGSTSLILQAVLPLLLQAPTPSRVIIRGGTNVAWSPTAEYLEYVLLPAIARLGACVDVDRTIGGWYPRGGGEIVVGVEPLTGALQPVKMADRQDLQRLLLVSTVSEGLPGHILGRQIAGALRELGEVPVEIEQVLLRPGGGPGTTALVAGEFTSGRGGYSALGRKGFPAERVGAEAGREFRRFLDSGAGVDEYLADQLLVYLALCDGTSEFTTPRITEHLRTVAWVIRQFWPVRIEFGERQAGASSVRVWGRSLPRITEEISGE